VNVYRIDNHGINIYSNIPIAQLFRSVSNGVYEIILLKRIIRNQHFRIMHSLNQVFMLPSFV